MDKNLIILFGIVVVVVAVIVGAIYVTGGFNPKPVATPAPLPEGIVLFFAQDCPHCKIVEDFITANNIDQKVKYTKLEVPFNGKTSPELEANAALAIKQAQVCKMDTTNGISIPFLWDGSQSKCYLGQDDVINLFKQKAGIQ